MALFLESVLEYKMLLEMSIRWFVFFSLKKSFVFLEPYIKIRFVYHQYVNGNAFLVTTYILWLFPVHIDFSSRGKCQLILSQDSDGKKSLCIASIWEKKRSQFDNHINNSPLSNHSFLLPCIIMYTVGHRPKITAINDHIAKLTMIVLFFSRTTTTQTHMNIDTKQTFTLPVSYMRYTCCVFYWIALRFWIWAHICWSLSIKYAAKWQPATVKYIFGSHWHNETCTQRTATFYTFQRNTHKLAPNAWCGRQKMLLYIYEIHKGQKPIMLPFIWSRAVVRRRAYKIKKKEEEECKGGTKPQNKMNERKNERTNEQSSIKHTTPYTHNMVFLLLCALIHHSIGPTCECVHECESSYSHANCILWYMASKSLSKSCLASLPM